MRVAAPVSDRRVKRFASATTTARPRIAAVLTPATSTLLPSAPKRSSASPSDRNCRQALRTRIQAGSTKAEQHRQRRGEGGGRPAPALEPSRRRDARRAAGEGEATVVAQRPLEPEQQRDGGQRRKGDLRRAAEVVPVQPRRIDRDSQRVYAQILAGADIVQRLQHHQRGARRHHRRERRQHGAPQRLQPRAAEAARRIMQRRPLHREGGAARDIDVG